MIRQPYSFVCTEGTSLMCMNTIVILFQLHKTEHEYKNGQNCTMQCMNVDVD